MTDNKKKRVVVAMSGGVDSSVAAGLLQNQGYEVVGISMRLYAYEAEASHGCCTPEDLYDARKVAERLNIPYYVANMEDCFEEKVVDQFVEAYARGETPNPCVRCNTDIKFSALLNKAKELGADFLATGHYARVEKCEGNHRLLKARDEARDQSYFLFGLSQQDLSKVLFPLGHLTKHQVRELAEKMGLAVHAKPDSQEICFVPADYRSFIEQRLEAKRVTPGLIKGVDGAVLGEHGGIHRFTVGQRKGLGIPGALPMYVVAVSPSGDVMVGQEADLYRPSVRIDAFRWVGREAQVGDRVNVKIRSKSVPVLAQIKAKQGELLELAFGEPQKSVSPGQAGVLYQDDEVLGGGWIKAHLKEEDPFGGNPR